jgi:hypothetical protein
LKYFGFHSGSVVCSFLVLSLNILAAEVIRQTLHLQRLNNVKQVIADAGHQGVRRAIEMIAHAVRATAADIRQQLVARRLHAVRAF